MRLAALTLLWPAVALAQFASSADAGVQNFPAAARAFAGNGASAACVATLQGSALLLADWTPANLTNVSPTFTANFGPGPTGSCDSTGMVRLQVPSAAGAQYSAIFNKNQDSAHDFCPSTGGNPISYGCHISAATTVDQDVCHFVSGAWNCATVTATSTDQFFKRENQTWATCAAPDACQFLIGAAPVVNGSIARNAADLRIWGCRCVQGATISP